MRNWIDARTRSERGFPGRIARSVSDAGNSTHFTVLAAHGTGRERPIARLSVIYRWRPEGIVARLLAIMLSLVFLIAVLLFSLVIFSIVAAAALLALAFGWWRIRSARQRNGRAQVTGQVINVESREECPRDHE